MKPRQGYRWHPRAWRVSARQQRVLDLLVEDRTNPEIAAALGMTLDGAKWHVSELLAQTGRESRQDLAAWWRCEREQHQERQAAFAPLFGLARVAGMGAAGVIAAAAIIGMVFLLPRLGRGDGAAPESTTLAAAVASPSPTVNPTPTSPPSPTPPAQSGAWVFDLTSRTATPLPLLLSFRQWLRDAPATFVGYGAGGEVVADAEGHIIAQVAAAGATQARPVTLALQDEGKVLLWRPEAGTLGLFEPDTRTESQLAGFGAAPAYDWASSRRWAITALGRRIALTEVLGDRVRVAVSALDGSNRRTVFEGRGDAWIAEMAWSPDGQRLLLRTGPRPASPQEPVTADSLWVVDVEGTVLPRQAAEPGGSSWAGPQRLMVNLAVPSGSPRRAVFIDVDSGRRTPAPDPSGLLCVSPDGRFGVYGRPLAPAGGRAPAIRQRVVELASGAVLVEAETAAMMAACDWTWDSTRVVLSPGGK